jgi:hypothetical protein
VAVRIASSIGMRPTLRQLVEGLRPVVLALLDDLVQAVRLGRVLDEVTYAPGHDHDLAGRDPARSVDAGDEPLGDDALEHPAIIARACCC